MLPLHHRHRGEGQTLAEFALVLPIVVLLLLALFDVGRAIYSYNAITNAAREGARLAIVNQDETTIQARTVSQGGGAIADVADVTVQFLDSASGDPCDGSGSNPELSIGCTAQVDALTRWEAITPVIGTILGPIDLTASSSLSVEFVCGVPAAPITDPTACPKKP